MLDFPKFLKLQIGNKSLGYVEKVSGVSKSYISKLLRGERDSPPKPETLKKLAKALPCSYEDLMLHSGYSTNKTVLPVIGRIPAGIPFEAIEDIEGYIDINPKFSNESEYFALKVKGDSMSPRILDGDVVIVKKQDDADTEDICVIMINGNDATLKKIKKKETGLLLVPLNRAYDPVFFSNAEILSLPVRIIGKVVELRGNI